jgi:hypothetical protein
MADNIFTPTMQQQIEQLLQQQTDQSARTTPIHQAAMAMASRMAPGYAQSAMTGPSAAPAVGSLFPSSSSSGGPGVGSTATLALFAALMKKNPAFMSALKGLMGGSADPTFGGLIQGNKPFAGGSGFPGVPAGGGGASGDPTQPGGAQGQMGSQGLPFFSAYGGSGSPPTGGSGQQPNYSDEDSRQSR